MHAFATLLKDHPLVFFHLVTAFGALVLGVPEKDGSLRYVGDVGTGFTQRQRREAAALLTEIAAADHPFTAGTTPHRTGSAHLRWVTPTLVGTIEYREFHRRVRTPGEVVWPELDAL